MPVEEDAVDFLEYHAKQFIDEIEMILGQEDEQSKVSCNIADRLRVAVQKQGFCANNLVVDTIARSPEEFIRLLAISIQFNNIEALRRLVQYPGFFIDMTLPNGEGTVLHMAVRYRSRDAIRLLVEVGFDPAVTTKEGNTVLHEWVYSNLIDDDTLRKLATPAAIRKANSEGRTVWHEAASFGAKRTLEVLLGIYGNDNDSLSSKSDEGHTPLVEAIISNHTDTALYLSESLEPDDSMLRDLTALCWCTAKGNSRVLQRLYDLGCRCKLDAVPQFHPLYWITRTTTVKVVDLLLSQGLHPDTSDSENHTPFLSLLSMDCRPAGLHDHIDDDTEIELPVIERIVNARSGTPFRDLDHLVWQAFCKSFVPRLMNVGGDIYWYQRFEKLVDQFNQQQTIHTYEKRYWASGPALLVVNFLDTIPRVRWPWRYEFLNTVIQFPSSYAFAKSPQAVRLLLHCLVEREAPENLLGELISKLLERGTDVHSRCPDYGTRSAVSHCLLFTVIWISL
jgi:hypothetical protein